jgi:hypothetical protein
MRPGQPGRRFSWLQIKLATRLQIQHFPGFSSSCKAGQASLHTP